MKRLKPNFHSLAIQMILSFMTLVLLAAVAAGLPAIWLICEQLERQAWAQVAQGSRTAQALYAAKQNEITDLAILTAQRPTLHKLLTQEDPGALSAYLRTFQVGAGLDLVLLCDSEGRVIAQAEDLISDIVGAESQNQALCTARIPAGFHVVSTGSASQVRLMATHSISDEAPNSLGKVIVNMALDDQFAAQMRTQTGLEHTLLVDGQPVATSLAGGVAARQSVHVDVLDDALRGTFNLDGNLHYITRFLLSEPGLEAEVALAVADVTTTQRRVVWTLVGSLLAEAAVGSLVGAFLARRISRPLAHLANSAAALTKGDLTRPVAVEARVQEVTMVAQALEGARADLQRTLVQLRQEKAWVDHLLEAIVEGIMTLDRRGHITFFSQGAERITGWKRDQVMGRPCDQVFRPAEADEPFTRLIPTPGQRCKIPVELRHEHQAILSISGARLLPPASDDVKPPGLTPEKEQLVLVFRDVSEEEAMHRLLGHFLANVAHEFRTPLSALAASVELLLDQAPVLSATELQELLTSLHLGVLGLQTLVDNLLESANIEAGRFRVYPRPSNLGEIIAEAIRTMQPLLDKHSQRLIVELPAAIPVVQTDPRRTAQILVNLLSNASKYGPDDAEIVISAMVHEGWVRVMVIDQGPGIAPEYRKALFHRFVHPSLANDKAQYGAGLGLSVVRAIVEAHGGEVGVKDRPGGGSIFWFTLPVVSE
jgi:signal transduction histidine kinase